MNTPNTGAPSPSGGEPEEGYEAEGRSVDFVLPPAENAQELTRTARHPSVAPHSQAEKQEFKKFGDFTRSVIDTVREPLLVLDSGLKVVTANPSFYAAFQLTPEDTLSRPLHQLGNGTCRP